jgi:hypothetical protein
MTYADEEAGSSPSAGDGDGQGDQREANGGTADATAADVKVGDADAADAGATASGEAADGEAADGAPSKVAAWFERKVRLLGQPEPLVTLAVVRMRRVHLLAVRAVEALPQHDRLGW